jgi:hypothetical protein
MDWINLLTVSSLAMPADHAVSMKARHFFSALAALAVSVQLSAAYDIYLRIESPQDGSRLIKLDGVEGLPTAGDASAGKSSGRRHQVVLLGARGSEGSSLPAAILSMAGLESGGSAVLYFVNEGAGPEAAPHLAARLSGLQVEAVEERVFHRETAVRPIGVGEGGLPATPTSPKPAMRGAGSDQASESVARPIGITEDGIKRGVVLGDAVALSVQRFEMLGSSAGRLPETWPGSAKPGVTAGGGQVSDILK